MKSLEETKKSLLQISVFAEGCAHDPVRFHNIVQSAVADALAHIHLLEDQLQYGKDGFDVILNEIVRWKQG